MSLTDGGRNASRSGRLPARPRSRGHRPPPRVSAAHRTRCSRRFRDRQSRRHPIRGADRSRPATPASRSCEAGSATCSSRPSRRCWRGRRARGPRPLAGPHPRHVSPRRRPASRLRSSTLRRPSTSRQPSPPPRLAAADSGRTTRSTRRPSPTSSCASTRTSSQAPVLIESMVANASGPLRLWVLVAA